MQDFHIGAVVVPASDGTLQRLGHDVQALGEKALGFVVETRGTKILAQFPQLKLTLWLTKGELADVYARAAEREPEFMQLIPLRERALRERNLSWIVHELVRELSAKHILTCEHNETLTALWSDPHQKLTEFYTGPGDIPAAYVGLGVAELSLESWRRAEAYLGEELLFARFLPAGMHKLELAIYLRR